MKRRNFIYSLIGIGTLLNPLAIKLANASTSSLVWIKENALGYKRKATRDKVNQGKICLSCSWYIDDSKHEFGGECKLKSMQNLMKSPKVMAHAAGNCNMWQKKN